MNVAGGLRITEPAADLAVAAALMSSISGVPVTGDAVIFSCYLVHEALPVIRGERFVLLTFFYGEEGEGKPR